MDRKKFLITSSLFLVGARLLQANTLVSDTYFQEHNELSNAEILLLLKQAADIRKNRGEKQSSSNTRTRRSLFVGTSSGISSYASAYGIYDKIIVSNPREIRAYDGKRKLMYQEGRNIIEVLEMYEQAGKSQFTNGVMKERIAREYLIILTGYTTKIDLLSSPLNDRSVLLKAVIEHLTEAEKLTPHTSQISAKLNKIKELTAIGFYEGDARDNSLYKARAKNFKTLEREKFSNLTSATVNTQIGKLRQRGQNEDRQKALVLREKNYIKKLRKEKRYVEAVEEAVKYYNRNPKDVDGLKLVRNTLKKNKRYDLLETIERANNKNKKSFWSNIALISILLKRSENDKKNRYSECQNLLADAHKKIKKRNEDFEWKRLDMLNKVIANEETVEKDLILFGDDLIGISSVQKIDTFVSLCAQYYYRKNEVEKGIYVINVALQNIKPKESDEKLHHVLVELCRFRTIESTSQNRDLEILRDKFLIS